MSSFRIGHGVARIFFSISKQGRFLQRSPRLAVEMRGKSGKSGKASGASGAGGSSGPKQPAYQFNSDGTRVLDRGVWKEFKTCSQCQRIFVKRKAFEKSWLEVKYCSAACRSKSKSKPKQSQSPEAETDE